MAVKSFKVSTEEVNTNRLIIKTDGGDFGAFLKNPVMLYNHDVQCVVGKWENLRTENAEILADPVFDMEDEYASKIAGKVERGFIKASSIGLRPQEAREVMLDDRKIIEVTKWELREISIVSIPSNRNALRLLDANDQEIELSDVITLSDILPAVIEPISTNPPKTMELKDVAKALNLADTATEAEVQIALNEAATAKSSLAALEKKVQDERKREAISLIDAAVAEKRLPATLKDQYIKLADVDFELFKTQLASLPKPQNLADFAHQGAVNAETLTEDEAAIKLYDSLDKNNGLVKLKKENPTEFERIYTAKWGKKPQ